MYIENNEIRHIFLIGFMGTGKSSVARELGILMGVKSVDADTYIEEMAKLSIKNIFASRGEEYFRGLESEALKELSSQPACVIACGGGAALRKENREIMKRTGTVVRLTASRETIEKRVQNNGDRPLLKERQTLEQISALMDSREQCYREIADITISTDEKQIREICSELIEKITLG